MEQIKPAATKAVSEPQTGVLQVAKVEEKVGVQPQVVKKLPVDNNAKVKLIGVGLIVVLAGVGTGWALSGTSAAPGEAPAPSANVSENPESVGEIDESVFSSTAQGVLHEGGIEGEGTHYLDTGAGAEKYVYLLSTVLDLSSFVDKKVEVQGQTLAAEHAGWLMDVGRIKEIQ